jgi:DNA-binding phage protein
MTNGDDVKIAKEAGVVSTVTKVLTEKARPKFSSILPSIHLLHRFHLLFSLMVAHHR